MRSGLIFAGEVQVNVRHLAAAIAQEGLKRNIKSILDVFRSADRTDFVRHIRTAAVRTIHNKLMVLAVGTAVVGRQSVYLRDSGHIRHQ